MISLLTNTEGATRTRWLLLASLVLNLFFVGAAGAVAFRFSSAVPLSNVARIQHGATDRLDRLAATLPSTDAQLMRSELRAEAVKVATAQADLRLSQDEFRNSLRAEPFDLDAMRAAMDQVRAARDNFDLVLHDVIAASAVKMSVVGRNKLADWPAKRVRATTPQ
jgi:uncharacterized membrane protein